MRVPVPGAKLPVEGASGAFLYQRREDHFHQGLDIGALYDPEAATVDKAEHHRMRKAGELPILSVLDGVVVEVRPNDVGSYGRIVVVQSSSSIRGADELLWHLYSHCSVVLCKAGDTVLAGQAIALVGWSGNAGRSNPHLHFEMATAKLPTVGGPKGETTPSKGGIRFDPRQVLAALPPFGTRIFTPRAAEPTEFDRIAEATLHGAVELAGRGGYFPLGANNTWHGGVHLPFTAKEDVYCPFDGQIVAARLDPDPSTSLRQHGNTNFILVRHELPLRLYHQLRGTTPPRPGPAGGGGKPAKKSGLGGNYDNDPDLVERAREALRGKGHYPNDAPAPKLELGDIEPKLIEAIEAFQATLDPPGSYTPWPDGSMRFEGFTWDALFEDTPQDGPTHPDDDTDPDPPEEPAEDDDSLPARRPPHPEDPKRVVYSLFMHLAAETFSDALAKRFAWLQTARLHETPKDPPAGIDEDLERARKHREDLAESASHRITKHIGKGEENPDDVKWVRKRLHRFDILPSDDGSGVLDDAIRDAILRFQQQYVYRKHPAKASSVIHRGRKSDMTLRKSRRQLGIDPVGAPVTIDPLVRVLLCERGVDGMTRVLSNLSVPISAGEPLWVPGQAGGFTDDGGIDLERRIHWAMFSEHEIFVDDHDGWASVIDTNEDLTADAPRALMDLVADWPVDTPLDDLPPDGIIDPAELAAFYADAASDFLRRRQCHFRSEWGLDVEATATRLSAQGWAADGLRVSLLPYQWWFDAADVLPAGTHVWHYNPIEFLGACRNAVDALAPEPPKSRERYGSVRVRVVNHRGGPAVDAEVEVIDSESTVHSAVTDAPARNGSGGGIVDFPDVRAGACTLVVSKHGEAHPIAHEHVRPGWDANSFVIETAFDGPEPARGDVNALVRRLGQIFKPAVDLQLVDAAGRVVASQVSKNAKAKFDAVAVGEYVLRSVDGESDPATVTLDRARSVHAVVRRKPEPAELMVTVLHRGSPAPGVQVRVTDAKTGALAIGGLGQTDQDGRCVFALRRGRHYARVGKKKAHVNLLPGRANEALLEVDGALSPDDPHGVLHIRVTDPVTEAKVPVSVFVQEELAVPLHQRHLDAAGELVLRVPSGAYRIVYDRREAEGSVHGGTYNAVDL